MGGKKIVQSDRPQMTTWLMRIACCIPKATNTYSEYVILIAAVFTRTRLNITLYVRCVSGFHSGAIEVFILPRCGASSGLFLFDVSAFEAETTFARDVGQQSPSDAAPYSRTKNS